MCVIMCMYVCYNVYVYVLLICMCAMMYMYVCCYVYVCVLLCICKCVCVWVASRYHVTFVCVCMRVIVRVCVWFMRRWILCVCVSSVCMYVSYCASVWTSGGSLDCHGAFVCVCTRVIVSVYVYMWELECVLTVGH